MPHDANPDTTQYEAAQAFEDGGSTMGKCRMRSSGRLNLGFVGEGGAGADRDHHRRGRHESPQMVLRDAAQERGTGAGWRNI